MVTSVVRGKINVSMDRRVNEQQTDRVDIKRRDGATLKTAQRNDGEDGGDDEVGTTRDVSMA